MLPLHSYGVRNMEKVITMKIQANISPDHTKVIMSDHREAIVKDWQGMSIKSSLLIRVCNEQ